MSYQNPDIVLIPSPIGLDAAIQSIQEELDIGLPWLEKSFGRAWEHKETDADGNTVKVPKCYVGEGEYFNVLPNDFLRAYSFIAVRGPENWETYTKASASGLTRDISVIFWVNLKEIDPDKDYIFTESLKAEVEKVLKANAYVGAITSYYDERIEDVFDGYMSGAQSGTYSINDTKTQYLMYPYAGFRFDLKLQYPEVCL